MRIRIQFSTHFGQQPTIKSIPAYQIDRHPKKPTKRQAFPNNRRSSDKVPENTPPHRTTKNNFRTSSARPRLTERKQTQRDNPKGVLPTKTTSPTTGANLRKNEDRRTQKPTAHARAIFYRSERIPNSNKEGAKKTKFS